MRFNNISKILHEATNREGLPSQQEVANFLAKYYPEESEEDKLFHDHWGLFSKKPNGVVKRILLCTTPTTTIINFAKKEKYDLVISHHDFLFNNPEVPQIIYHSAMDESERGHNKYFMTKMGLKNLKEHHKVLLQGDLYKPLTLDQFKEHLIKRGFEINGMVWERPDADNQISSVLYCSGMGGMLLGSNHIIDARKFPADVYVTGELTSNPANVQGNPFKYIIELGHTSSEKPLFKWIKNMLLNRWKNLQVDLADKTMDIWGSDTYKARMEQDAQRDKEWAERQKYWKDNPVNYDEDDDWLRRFDEPDFFDHGMRGVDIEEDHPLIVAMVRNKLELNVINNVADYLEGYYENNNDPDIQTEIFTEILEYLWVFDEDLVNEIQDDPEKFFPNYDDFLSEGLNIPKREYIVKWLEFPVGNRAFGGGGWSKRAKYKPSPEIKTIRTSDVVFDGKSVYVNGNRKLKVNVYLLDGTPIREDYSNINEGLNLPKKKLDTPEGWFKDILNNLTEYRSPNRPLSIFYKLDNDVVMEMEFNDQDQNSGTLWVSYSKIWSVFETRFNMNRLEIQGLIKSKVEETYNLRGVTPNEIVIPTNYRVEETYNLREVTPHDSIPMSL